MPLITIVKSARSPRGLTKIRRILRKAEHPFRVALCRSAPAALVGILFAAKGGYLDI